MNISVDGQNSVDQRATYFAKHVLPIFFTVLVSISLLILLRRYINRKKNNREVSVIGTVQYVQIDNN